MNSEHDIPADDYKFDLGYCKTAIKAWKMWYMKKNSKYPAFIQLRCHCPGLNTNNWKYYIELWINGKMKDQTLIMKEAYDTFDYDKTLEKSEYPNLEFITLYRFLPTAKKEDKQK